MNTSNIIKATINATKHTVTAPIVKEDYGLILKIEGGNLPPTYEVDFSNEERNGTSVTMIGTVEDGVQIPTQLIKTGRDVFAFLYFTGDGFGRTVYKFRIPNRIRPDRTNAAPTPEQQSALDQAIEYIKSAREQL